MYNGRRKMLLARGYEASQAKIKSAEVPEVDIRPGEGFADRAKCWWAQGTDMGKKIDALKTMADNLIEHLVRLAAVFMVQTIVLPLLFLWVILWFYRVLSGPPQARIPEGKAERTDTAPANKV